MVDLITDPGKFQSEPTYVPYFWDMVMNGFGDVEYDDFGNMVDIFEVDDTDRAKFPDLGDAKVIRLWESEQGFVYHELSMG